MTARIRTCVVRIVPHWAFIGAGYFGAMNTSDFTNRVQDWQKRAADTARNVGQNTDRCVRENTWTTLALAALVGCVVGYLLAPERDSS
jgi:hypothetical protein